MSANQLLYTVSYPFDICGGKLWGSDPTPELPVKYGSRKPKRKQAFLIGLWETYP